MRFSERIGKREVKSAIQINSMDDDLRNCLWNLFTIYFPELFGNPFAALGGYQRGQAARMEQIELRKKEILSNLWHGYFKKPIDEISSPGYGLGGMCTQIEPIKFMREHFMNCEWFEAYDFLEYILQIIQSKNRAKFIEDCNQVLEKEGSGYKFIDDKIMDVTSKEEIREIEDALTCEDIYTPVSRHMKTAIELYSDRKQPNYPNAAKEAMSAVEAMCKIISNKNNCTLTDAMRALEKNDRAELHGALKEAYIKLYAYASDAEGIRHANLDEGNFKQEDARYFIVVCSAFINYLKEKRNKSS